MKFLPAVTVFSSALLLFLLELLVGRVALPRFGGSAAVWTTCLLFFQVMLVAGYGWAHLLATRVPPGRHALAQLGLGLLALGSLAWQWVAWGAPLVPATTTWNGTAWDVLGFLARTTALPFLVLSTTASLVQSAVRSERGGGAFRLYAVSNAGALIALLVYPVGVEPFLGMAAQAKALTVGFGLFLAALVLTLSGRAATTSAGQLGTLRLSWLVLPALGTALLSSATNALCQDLTPTPLLWAFPLAVYLLTFIIGFGDARWRRPLLSAALFVIGVLGLALTTAVRPDVDLPLSILTFGLVLFGGCWWLHAELHERRPAPEALSSFYLQLALGGALGTAVVGVVAPVAFEDFYELPITVTATGLAMVVGWPRGLKLRGLGVVATGLSLLAFGLWVRGFEGQRESMRSAYGVIRVQEENSPGSPLHAFALRHGDTLHGFQLQAPGRLDEPTAYFTRTSGLGVGIEALHDHRPGPVRATILGLGIGVAAALFQAGDVVDFIELSPDVIELARRTERFSFLSRARATVTVREGEARGTLVTDDLSQARPADLLVVDVFSGDSVPMHLLTVEAVALYQRRLTPNGLLALHVSNRYLELVRVAAGVLARNGLQHIIVAGQTGELATYSVWVLASNDAALLERARRLAGENAHALGRPTVVWTDDLQSVVPIFLLGPGP
ncbi:MAG: ferrichrome ABC transporter permease [Myxococcaceae bacterium]|nr:ferrichrome ABC transporter permease [Myxococcaceae bacterium]